MLKHFFEYYLHYNWKASNPVLITELKNDPDKVNFSIPPGLLYDPNTRDLMPIITPAFPAQNSTHNVSESTKKVMMTEIEKAHIIVKEIQEVKDDSIISWQRLFKKFPFFKAFNHFIQITVLSKNERT